MMTDEPNDCVSTATLLIDNAERVFSELCTKEIIDAAEAGTWPDELWNTLERLGFTRAAVPEHLGGTGLSLGEALPMVRIAGRHAVPLPFGETLVAAWLLAQAGLEVPLGPLAFAPADRRSKPSLHRTAAGWTLDGSLRNIPWGERAVRIVLVATTDAGCMVASIDPAPALKTSGKNLAGEPRVRLDFREVRLADEDVKPAPASIDAGTAFLYGALLRGQQMAGALGSARDLTVRYTGERIAFGKPLNRLQAVQQNLAVLAGQAAAANVAADMVLDAVNNATSDLFSCVGLAKVRIDEAADIGARLAHQAHGAIGFTYEHKLHLMTRRLWSWRDEFGNGAYWAEHVGQRVIDAGPEGLWNFITGTAQL